MDDTDDTAALRETVLNLLLIDYDAGRTTPYWRFINRLSRALAGPAYTEKDVRVWTKKILYTLNELVREKAVIRRRRQTLRMNGEFVGSLRA